MKKIDEPMNEKMVKELTDKAIGFLSLKSPTNEDEFLFSFDKATQSLIVKKGFKVMKLPLALVKESRWTDIQHIYRSVFDSSPQVENFSHNSDNEWSRH